MYQPKKGEMFYESLKVLRWLQLYPSADDLNNWQIYIVKIYIIKIVGLFLFIEYWLHLIMGIVDKKVVNMAEDIEGITGIGYATFVCSIFQYNFNDWCQFFHDVVDTTKFGKPHKFDDVVYKTNFLSKSCFWLTSLFVIIYSVLSLLDTEQCQSLNQKNGTHEICGTVTILWWPTEHIDSRIKVFISVYQLLAFELFIPTSAIIAFIVLESVMVIQEKSHHLKQLFKESFECNNPVKTCLRFKFCIRYHNEIFRLCDKLNKLTKWVIGQLAVTAAIVLGCISNRMITEQYYESVVYLCGYLMIVFVACHAGQILKDETMDIQDALYKADWTKTNKETIRDVQYVMLRCQKPAILKAIPVGTFDYGVLIIIIKTSYSYLTLLNNQV